MGLSGRLSIGTGKIYGARFRRKHYLFEAAVMGLLVVSSNPIYGEVYSIQHNVIKFVSDLRQVGAFLRFLPPIKTDRH